MTDSMNFGPDWIRNLSSEGTTGGGIATGTRYQLADYRYGREEMLALFDKNVKPPPSLTNFKNLYSDVTLAPLALIPATDEDRGWQNRAGGLSGPGRGRGGSLERGRISRGRGGYTTYGRPAGYDGGWGNGEQSEWSPRKEYNPRTMSMDNWRRNRSSEEEDGWRSGGPQNRSMHDKWGRSTSWREDGEVEERTGAPVRGGRWYDSRGMSTRRSLDSDDHLPEWAMENPTERGGSFDERGAFHGSDDEFNDGNKGMNKQREAGGLQKSTSQQHIKALPNQLTSSKSAASLLKMDDKRDEPLKEPDDEGHMMKENGTVERKVSIPKVLEKVLEPDEMQLKDDRQSLVDKSMMNCNGPMAGVLLNNKDDEDFDRLQEDLVLKLVVDEEPSKPAPNTVNNFDVGGVQPPPNLAPPLQEKWFYQDPQGDLQGPFVNMEMAEWYKAGYFSNQLKVRRQCDERFFLLGELINMSGGANPFQSGIRFPILKNDLTKLPDQERIQLQYYSQLAAFKQAQAARALSEPWNNTPMTLQQQQELAAQRLLLQQQQQQQVPPDLPFLQQPPPTPNPLMHMINQMQQANKLPTVPNLVEKPSNTIPNAIDPHLQMHMSTILMQNRLQQQSGIPNHLPGGLPTNLPGSMPPGGLSASLPGLPPMAAMQNSMPGGLAGAMNLTAAGTARPTQHGAVDQMQPTSDNNPISNLLKQLQQKEERQKIDALWQQSVLATSAPPTVPPARPPVNANWQVQGAPDVPLSMWDVQQANVSPTNVPGEMRMSPDKQMLKGEKESQRSKDEKELKKKKELEEKQAKKDADEKRKMEQRRLEIEKRLSEEKKKKEEERIQKELEKVKKLAEEKRMKELEEKRKLKELRKLEEDAKKKVEETKRQEEERHKRELREMEEKRLAEEKKMMQEQLRMAKAAPWSQSNSTLGMSLAEIQKAEREKRAQEALQMQQRLQLQVEMQQQLHQDKPAGGLNLNWAKKPVEPRKVKSLAEIQQEEQEMLSKVFLQQAAEARLQKEKDVPPVVSSGNIWSSQSLTWANPPTNTTSQWTTGNTTGFWDESSIPKQPQSSKPSTVSKSNPTINAVSSAAKTQPVQQPQQQPKQPKSKTKKEDTPTAPSKTNNNNNNNGPNNDEFNVWCYKTLANISPNVVDIPTFVAFLRDIESAFDIKEYCKEYLGDSTATQQFANSFVEKRRSYKTKNAHKDDSSTTAQTVTPYLQHSTEFQEVKGKNKKNKKSKMLKVDSRILGFNVTSAPDRINVGDRDYGDNS